MTNLNYIQFCVQNNYPTHYDTMSDAISMSSPGNSNNLAKSKIRNSLKALSNSQDKVLEGKRAYNEYLKTCSPDKKSLYQDVIDTANGHPDNESTQAARRILARKDIRWD